MKILFPHGWQSVVGGVKPTRLKDAGHGFINPALDDFDLTVRIAQAEYDQHKADVLVDASRGGAVVLSGDTPLVLRCPVWKGWGNATKLKQNSATFTDTNTT